MGDRRRQQPPPPLHLLEAEVMEEMWQRQRGTVREVLEALNKGRKKRAYTTVMTTMRRLDEKGLLTRKRQGKTDFYAVTISRDDYRDSRAEAEVAGLVDQFGEVALTHFARQMESLAPQRARRLRRLAKDG
jgi:BlaI family transcriptional regulator, penicillinase repressor